VLRVGTGGVLSGLMTWLAWSDLVLARLGNRLVGGVERGAGPAHGLSYMQGRVTPTRAPDQMRAMRQKRRRGEGATWQHQTKGRRFDVEGDETKGEVR
jgi:hypothetical protein